MFKRKPLLLALGVLVVAGLLGFVFTRDQSQDSEEDETVGFDPSAPGYKEARAQNKKDIKAVNEASLSEPNRDNVGAMLRLSQQNNPRALELALEWVESSDPNSQRSAIKALGFYSDPKATEALSQVLEDNPSMRQLTIAALGEKQVKGRYEILKKHLKQSKNEIENVWIYAALVKAATVEQERKSAYDFLQFYLKESWPTQVQKAAIEELFKIDPSNPRLVEALAQALTNPSKFGEAILLKSIMVLGRSPKHRKILQKEFQRAVFSDSPNVRRVAIENLKYWCPSNLEEISKKIANTDRKREHVVILAKVIAELPADRKNRIIATLESSSDLDSGEAVLFQSASKSGGSPVFCVEEKK